MPTSYSKRLCGTLERDVANWEGIQGVGRSPMTRAWKERFNFLLTFLSFLAKFSPKLFLPQVVFHSISLIVIVPSTCTIFGPLQNSDSSEQFFGACVNRLF